MQTDAPAGMHETPLCQRHH